MKSSPSDLPVIRTIEPGDVLAINNEFNRVFGQTRSLREWNWKFGEHGSRSEILVAVDGEENIVAHYAALKIRIVHHGEPIDAGHIVDIFSSRESAVVRHRIFLKLQKEFHQRFGESGRMPLQFGFPGVRAERLINVTGVCVNGRPLRIWKDDPEAARISEKISGWKVGEKYKNGEIDRLWETAKSRHHFSAVRDDKWLRDRYTKRPGINYKILVVRRSSIFGRRDIEAWGVFLEREDRVLWVDLEWNGRDESVLDALWREAKLRLCAETERVMEIWLDGDPTVESWLEKRHWNQTLWTDGPRVSFVVFEPLDPAMTFNEKMRLTAGDTDLV